MAESIDERIVQLTLDNKQFNRASSETIDSIEKLKKTLEFEGAIDSFKEIEKEINKVDFSSINNGVDGVGKSFTILDTITDAVFRNMTNRVIDFGERTLKSLSTDQIITGWNKYAEQTGAVQTIMAATAQQFSDTDIQMQAVNDQLEKLTWFTDETSHKFNDMVGGIGKFTANNIDLETSVKAMEGIATWASLSGANANEASRAIYNLAQAVSVGSVKLIDWRSIENANMGTTEFKQTVIETAQEVGTLIKVTDGLYKTLSGKEVSIANFSENLSAGWFNSEVLLKSLDRYGRFADRLNAFADETGKLTATLLEVIDDYIDGTLDMGEATKITGLEIEDLLPWLEELGDESMDLGRRAFKAAQETKTFQEAIDYVKEAVSSGWATSFKYIFGDYLEAKEWWSEIAEVMYDAFVVGGEIRNTILSMWKDNGGRDDFLNGIRAIIENVMNLVDIFKTTWDEVWFGKDDENTKRNEQLENMVDLLKSITKGFKDFADAIKPTEQTAENLRAVLESIFTAAKSVVNIFKTLATAISPVFSALNIVAGTIFQVIGDIARTLTAILNGIFTPERLDKLAFALNTIARILSTVIQIALIAIYEIGQKLIGVFGNLYNKWQENGGGIGAIFTTLVQAANEFFDAFVKGETVVNGVADAIIFILGGLVMGIKTIIDTIIGLLTGQLTLDDMFGGNGGGIAGILKSFGKVLEDANIPNKLEALGISLMTFCERLVAADGIIVSFVESLKTAVIFLKDVFKNLLETVTIKDIKDFLLIAILWQFVTSLSKLNNSLSGVTNAFKDTLGSLNRFLKNGFAGESFIDKLNAIFAKTKILQIGVSLGLVVAALGQLNKLDWDQTQKSVAALVVTIGMLLAAFKAFSKIYATLPRKEAVEETEKLAPIISRLAVNIVALGAASLMIAQALKVLNETLYDEGGNFDWGKIFGSGGMLVVMVGGMVAVLKLLDGVDLRKSGKSFIVLVGIAASIRLLVNSISILAKLPLEEMAAATGMLTLMIIGLGASVGLMTDINWKSALAVVPTMLAFGLAMIEMVGAMALVRLALNGLNVDEMKDVVLVFVAIVVALTGAMSTLGIAFDDVKASTIMAISVSLISFAGSVTVLAKALDMVKNIRWSRHSEGLIALAGSVAIMVVSIGALGNILKQVETAQLTSIGLAFVGFASSVAILAGSLVLLQQVDWDKIKDAVTTISIMVGVFGILVGVLEIVALAIGGKNGAKAISEGFDKIGSAFLKFGLSISAIAAGLFLLNASMGVLALIVGTLQKAAKEMGISLPNLIASGFATVELIFKEFLAMLTRLGPDIFAAFSALLGTILLVIAAFKDPIAAKVVSIVTAIAWAISNHGQEIVDALIAIINFIVAAKDLLAAIQDLAYWIGSTLASVVLLAFCGALAGLVTGFGDCIEHWFGDGTIEGIDRTTPQISEAMNDSVKQAIKDMQNGDLDAEAREAAYQNLGSYIQGWKDREYELEDGLVDTGLAAMEKFEQETGKAIGDSPETMASELKKGIDRHKKDFIESGETMADLFRNKGWIKAQDPNRPMDMYDRDTDDIAANLQNGIERNKGIFSSLGEKMGGYLRQGWEYIVGNLDLDISLPSLVTGFGSNASDDADSYYKDMDDYYKMLTGELKSTNKDFEEAGNESANSFLDGLSSGISSGSGKAAKEAKTAAQTIAEAFADELDKISRDTQISDKLFKLWTAQNPTASEMEKSAKEIEYQSEKVALATQKASVTQQIYKQTLEAMGSEAKETHEAYMTMLDDQIALLEAQNKLADLTSSNAKDQKEAWQQYTNLIYQKDANGNYITDFLKNQGFTMEEISKAYAKEAGYILPTLAKDTSDAMMGIVSNTGAATNEAMVNSVLESAKASEPILKEAGASGVNAYNQGAIEASSNIEQTYSNVITNAAETTKPVADTKGKEVGLAIDQGVGKGIDDNVKIPKDASERMAEKTLDATNSFLEIKGGYSVKFWDVGKYIDQGIAKGIRENDSVITEAARLAAMRAYQAAREALNIASPSKVMEEVGKYYDLGLAVGIEDYTFVVRESAAKLVDDLVEETKDELSTVDTISKYINEALSSDDNTIVLDIDTTRLDEAIANYKATSEVINKQSKDLNTAYEKLREKAKGMGLLFERGGNTYKLEGFDSWWRREVRKAGLSQASSEIANMSTTAFSALQLEKTLASMEELNAKLDKMYDTSGIVVNYTQNNTSPEPLSRVDIYRDTKKQLATFKESIERNTKRR